MEARGRLRVVGGNEFQRIGNAARPQPAAARAGRRPPLGQILTEMQAVDPGNLLKAVAIRAREDVRLGDILLAHGWVREDDLMTALARQWSASAIDLSRDPPDPRLIDEIGAETCLKETILPWRRIGDTVVIATARPEDFAALRERLPAAFLPCRMVIASETAIHAALLSRRQTALIRRAEHRVPVVESCRTSSPAVASNIALGLIFALALGLMALPLATFSLIFGWTILTLIAAMGLKLVACGAEIWAHRKRRAAPPPDTTTPARLPVVSILLPLLHEPDIAGKLVARIGQLNYPRELLDVLLIVEADDDTTRDALARTRLPHWMRVVTVPGGPIRTKPRAMNYALNFCRGSIIGVYDAEDRPDPGQLHVIARRFATAPKDVACLQGILDYYNPRTNWLARCFTIEYAAWFRVMLPGMARLGLVLPLGGTTLFFRRDALEELGAWDAHNVTEDADLGLRLARHGYRTEMVPTVTHEEANCRPLPWIRQRSRWLKGYAMTWAVHMRDPAALWRDLGPKRFIGVQVVFLASLSQYLLAPVLWSCWLLLFGLPHPIGAVLPGGWLLILVALLVASEIVNVTLAAWAVRGPMHRHLLPWTVTMNLYFPLGALAAWRAIYEAVTRPFHWEKTAHGIFEHEPEAIPVPVEAPQRQTLQ
ncbi:glycosyltransferase [Sinirhodobacter populi]|uniref:Glycosyltransferase n=1 Tax=Paenirhodobacter populi TaxID=2306993 RepID=A0A443KQD1_9RHOB|nr:glycosyltransferase family 2 protein [Sinirhodobacter populi]RWR35130.1 glycosyltransferase [Sinirhodobacter populi]